MGKKSLQLQQLNDKMLAIASLQKVTLLDETGKDGLLIAAIATRGELDELSNKNRI